MRANNEMGSESMQLMAHASLFGDKLAIVDEQGHYSYNQLLQYSTRIASNLLGADKDLNQTRVAIIATADVRYVAAQWGVWRAGGVCVPLSVTATESEWEYALRDADCTIVLATIDLSVRVQVLCRRLNIRLIQIDRDRFKDDAPSVPLPNITSSRRAMILYTSGTTSKPKGVVTTHANIEAQITSLVKAWEWSGQDRIPLFLPLHHIHGIINVLSCGLWSGAVVEMFPRFHASNVLHRVKSKSYTLFMAVPTIYVKLIEYLEQCDEDERSASVSGFQSLRLMVSGSAALPKTVFERWFQLTSQKLLERYGMTEIGMALSNPFHGERRAGTVGLPLPGVEIRLKSEAGRVIDGEDEVGEIQVRGSTVFCEYWNRDQATAEAFDEGWFRTGDMAIIESGYYRILGRQSVDIIKSGGYKLSALEIEAVLLDHPAIRECAVVGLPHDLWGEAVTAVVVLKEGFALDTALLRGWCKERISPYKIPHHLLVVGALPRNAMGKVTKPAVQALAADSTLPARLREGRTP